MTSCPNKEQLKTMHKWFPTRENITQTGRYRSIITEWWVGLTTHTWVGKDCCLDLYIMLTKPDSETAESLRAKIKSLNKCSCVAPEYLIWKCKRATRSKGKLWVVEEYKENCYDQWTDCELGSLNTNVSDPQWVCEIGDSSPASQTWSSEIGICLFANHMAD